MFRQAEDRTGEWMAVGVTVGGTTCKVEDWEGRDCLAADWERIGIVLVNL